jgi:hypothetical protein
VLDLYSQCTSSEGVVEAERQYLRSFEDAEAERVRRRDKMMNPSDDDDDDSSDSAPDPDPDPNTATGPSVSTAQACSLDPGQPVDKPKETRDHTDNPKGHIQETVGDQEDEKNSKSIRKERADCPGRWGSKCVGKEETETNCNSNSNSNSSPGVGIEVHGTKLEPAHDTANPMGSKCNIKQNKRTDGQNSDVKPKAPGADLASVEKPEQERVRRSSEEQKAAPKPAILEDKTRQVLIVSQDKNVVTVQKQEELSTAFAIQTRLQDETSESTQSTKPDPHTQV